MKNRTLVLILLSCFSCKDLKKEREGIVDKRTKPNVIFIMGDDHTTQAISAYGGFLSEYARTSNIDGLAEEGMRFESVFATNSICSPSRATILTGKYSHKNGVRILRQAFDGSQFTVQSAFRTAGYQTALFGKWHLETLPTGFDDFKVLPVQGRYEDPQFIEKGEDSLITREGWSTDIISELTTTYLRKRDTTRPFLVMTHYKATHDPWSSRTPYDTLWSNEDLPEPENLYDTYENRSEAARRTGLKLELINQGTYPHERLENTSRDEQRGFIYQQYIKSFLRCGRVLDENIGKLIDFLKKEGLYDDTVIIYTADQGHFLGEHGFFSKRFMYDEAMRMPLIIRYPKWVEPGSVNRDLIINADFAPTLMDMADIDVPNDVQGRSFLPNLKGETPTDWREAVYYHYWQHILHREVAAHIGVRTQDKKLIFYYGLPLGQTDKPPTLPEWEFFDLKKDPSEMYNAINDPEYMATVDSLKHRLKELQIRYDDEGLEYPEMKAVQEKYFWTGANPSNVATEE